MKKQVFISYRQKDGSLLAQSIYRYLRDGGYHTFLDTRSIQRGPLDKAIFDAIDECNDLVVIVTPWLLSEHIFYKDDWIRQEVDYATEKGKNIIPVIAVESFPENLPENIARLNNITGVVCGKSFLFQTLENRLVSKPHSFIGKLMIKQLRIKDITLSKVDKTILFMLILCTLYLLLVHVVFFLLTEESENFLWKTIKPNGNIFLYTLAFCLMFLVGMVYISMIIERNSNIYYAYTRETWKSISPFDLNSVPVGLEQKLINIYPKKYWKCIQKDIPCGDQDRTKARKYLMEGIEWGSNTGERIDYLKLTYRHWHGMYVFCIGSHHTRMDVIKILSRLMLYIVDYDDHRMVFKSEEFIVVVFFGRIWPVMIEVKRNVKDWGEIEGIGESEGTEDDYVDERNQEDGRTQNDQEGQALDGVKIVTLFMDDKALDFVVLDEICLDSQKYLVVCTKDNYLAVASEMGTTFLPILFEETSYYNEVDSGEEADRIMRIFKERNYAYYNFLY